MTVKLEGRAGLIAGLTATVVMLASTGAAEADTSTAVAISKPSHARALLVGLKDATGVAGTHAPTVVTVEHPAVSLSDPGDGKFGMSLPGHATAGTTDGITTVYPSSGIDYSVASQQLNIGSARGLVTITGAAAPTHYSFGLHMPNGVTGQLAPNGGVSFVDANGQLRGVVQPPWAKDALGHAVPTHYELRGNTLTQVIAHRGAAYPVVADPSVQWHWWGVTVLFDRWETQVIGWGIGAVGAYLSWSGWAAIAAYAAPGLATWASSHGYCLGISRAWNGQIWPWAYGC